MRTIATKDIALYVATLSSVVAALWLWSRGPIYGIWIFSSLLSIGTYLVCRRNGWLVLFVVPLSFLFLFPGFEAGSPKLQGIRDLGEYRTILFNILGALFVVWGAAVWGTINWWRATGKQRDDPQRT